MNIRTKHNAKQMDFMQIFTFFGFVRSKFKWGKPDLRSTFAHEHMKMDPTWLFILGINNEFHMS